MELEPKQAPTRQQRIAQRLQHVFAPCYLKIENQSDQHLGHKGHNARGESHYHITIAAASFAGQSRLAIERAIYAALEQEWQSGLHALSITIKQHHY